MPGAFEDLNPGFRGWFGPASGAVGGMHAAARAMGGNGLPGHAVVHGEILNAAPLRRQLGLPAGTPMEQVLPMAWQRWSDALFERLDGVFALAICHDDELVLYRDPSGLRNLYWQRAADGYTTFATRLGEVGSRQAAAPALSRGALHEYLRFLDIAAPRTLFAGVHALEAGQMLRCATAGFVLRTPGAETTSTASVLDFDAAVDELGHHLQRSVQTRLADAGTAAAFLSGGVDSSLVCALGARQRQDITALTVGFEGAAFDEAPVAARIAAHLGLTHRVLRFGRAELVDAVARLGAGMDQPIADPATPVTVLAFDHCRGRFDVVLDGTGADEAVGAMPPRHVRLAVGYASLLPLALRRAILRGLRPMPRLAAYAPILDFEHPADTMIRWRGFTRAQIEELCGEPVDFGATQFYRTFAGFPRLAHYARYSALLNAMPCERLVQAMLISGAQVRYPFVERDTDRFLRRLPEAFRHRSGEPKRILRALLARFVPREIWDLPKRGFDFPLESFLAGDDFALVRRHLDVTRWRGPGLLRPEIVARYGRDFIAGDRRSVFRVWALVVLGCWLEQHGHAN